MVRRCREYAHPRLFLRLVLGKRHNLRSSLLDGTFPVCTSQELAECKPLLLKLVIDSQPMKRVLLLTILLHFFCNTSSFGCLCGPPEHASKYVKQASLVFVGKVVFTNDDGSGIFQHTLVHFEIEESFKGSTPDAHEVWIDPGSCSSCYETYRVGERYLVFAYGGFPLPTDTAAMSTANDRCRAKPLPQGINSQNPPKIYLAPGCSGTRRIDKETESAVGQEVHWLRNYRKKMERTRN